MPTSPTRISTLSLHDALPIFSMDDTRERKTNFCFRARVMWTVSGSHSPRLGRRRKARTLDADRARRMERPSAAGEGARSEEHTSELQSLRHLVCRLLLEKKKK